MALAEILAEGSLFAYRRLPTGRMLFVYKQLLNWKLGVGNLTSMDEMW